MRTETDLEKHTLRCNHCGQRYLLCNATYHTDLFHSTTETRPIVFPLRCNSYFCTDCARLKRNKLYHRALQHFKNCNVRFMTLTTNKTYYTTDEAIKSIASDWNQFLTELKHRYGDFRFFRVLEISDKLSVHLHILINEYIPQELIVRLWTRIHHSNICLIKRAGSYKDAIKYMLKYLSKDMAQPESNSYFYLYQKRRFSFSRHQLPEENKSITFKRLCDTPLSRQQLTDIIRFLYQPDDDSSPPPDISHLPQCDQDYFCQLCFH